MRLIDADEVIEELEQLKKYGACASEACGYCKYFQDCEDGTMSESLMADKAIEIVKKSAANTKTLEKQIPKKPITYTGTNRADCPVCMKTVRGIGKPFGEYCAGCGQRLKWEAED